MKKKKKTAKLTLHRETVRKLTQEEAGKVAGGTLHTFSRDTVCCPLSFTHCSACCP